MFGWLTGRIKRNRDDDIGELRASIIGDRGYEPPQPLQARPLEQQPAFQPSPPRGYEEFSPKTRDIFEPIPTASFPSSFEEKPEPPARNYELMDKLAIIESQLAAVRSMTETINERLKNLETRLGLQRRY